MHCNTSQRLLPLPPRASVQKELLRHNSLLCFPCPPTAAFSCRAPLQKPPEVDVGLSPAAVGMGMENILAQISAQPHGSQQSTVHCWGVRGTVVPCLGLWELGCPGCSRAWSVPAASFRSTFCVCLGQGHKVGWGTMAGQDESCAVELSTVGKPHRIPRGFLLEGTLKLTLLHPCHEQGHLP